MKEPLISHEFPNQVDRWFYVLSLHKYAGFWYNLWTIDVITTYLLFYPSSHSSYSSCHLSTHPVFALSFLLPTKTILRYTFRDFCLSPNRNAHLPDFAPWTCYAAAFWPLVFLMKGQLSIFLQAHCRSQYIVFYWFQELIFGFQLFTCLVWFLDLPDLWASNVWKCSLLIWKFSLLVLCLFFVLLSLLGYWVFWINVFIHVIVSCFWGFVNFFLFFSFASLLLDYLVFYHQLGQVLIMLMKIIT